MVVSERESGHRVWEWLVFMVGYLGGMEYFSEGVGISRNWAPAHFLVFYGNLWNCHSVSGGDF